MPNASDDCIAYLEKLRWGGIPECPYCGMHKSSEYAEQNRYHCNFCYTSFSVTVGTLFHKTHLDLQKWFQTIYLVSKAKKKVSARQLARVIKVNKNTAAYMLSRIRQATEEDKKLLQEMMEDPKFVEDCRLSIEENNDQ